jgi:hypothetical protein
LPGASLRPSLAFNPRHRRLSTPTDAFEHHPAIALRVTEHCIALNGADYTAWHRRWVLISDPQNLAKNPHALRDELAFAEKKALRTPKNYQVWNHVRLCVGAVGTAEVRRDEEDRSRYVHATPRFDHTF